MRCESVSFKTLEVQTVANSLVSPFGAYVELANIDENIAMASCSGLSGNPGCVNIRYDRKTLRVYSRDAGTFYVCYFTYKDV